MAVEALLAQEIATLEALRLERARSGFLNFLCYTKPEYEPTWYHRLMAAHANKIITGEIKRLIITLPPRHGKSENFSVRLPAYALGQNPNAQVICATYNSDYAKKINRDVQRVFGEPSYQRLFPKSRLNDKNVRSIAGSAIRNSEMFEMLPPYTGFYKSTSIGGPLTGFGGSLMICDDYCKNYDDAKSLAYRESVWDWWATTFTTRALKNCAIVICATRWHESDLIGKVLAQAKNPGASPWTVLNLPALAETPKHPQDPRKEGEALWPSHYPRKWLLEQRSINERAFVSMYLQRPAPQAGNIIQSSWWRYWEEVPVDLDMLVASADLSFNNDTGKNDFSVFTIWGRSGQNFYLIDMVRDRMNWLQQKAAMERIVREYPDLNAFYIENAALGAALVEEARRIIPGVIAITPKGGKGTRLEAVAGLIQAGNVFLPHAEKTGKTFAEAVVAECGVFPNGANDDIVDSLSMALNQLRTHGGMYTFTDLHEEKESVLHGLTRVVD